MGLIGPSAEHGVNTRFQPGAGAGAGMLPGRPVADGDGMIVTLGGGFCAYTDHAYTDHPRGWGGAWPPPFMSGGGW
ncbi:hypothetical protein UG55_100226 [Frankia sp. EI5c]|nr:hypothetical protein UG55_100226 [Frankia sp. EI5c]